MHMTLTPKEMEQSEDKWLKNQVLNSVDQIRDTRTQSGEESYLW